MMRRPFIQAVALGLFGVTLAPSLATAEITKPDCATLIAWASSTDFKARQTLNPSTMLNFPDALLGDEMVALYGKTGPEFTQDDVAQARQGIKDCSAQSGKADKKVLAGLDKLFGRDLGSTLATIAKAQSQLEPALAAFAAAPAGLDKLRAIAGLRAMETWDVDGYRTAVRFIGRDFNKILDGILRPLKSLPQAVVAEQVLPAVEPHYAESKDAALAEARQQIEAIEASQRSLQKFDREAAKITDPLEALLPETERAPLAEAVAARRVAIEQELIDAELQKLAGAAGFPALAATENAARGNLARVLSPEAAERFLGALRQRRQEAALALVAEVPSNLQGLSQLSQLTPALVDSPAALVGADERAALEQAIAEKRSAVGAAVAQDLLGRIDATQVDTAAFAALDRFTDERLLQLLAPEDAAAVRTAADARRQAIGDELSELLEDQLGELDDSEKSLAFIDTALLPGIGGWPASAGAHKTRLLDMVVARRNDILARITETQLGPLRGRSYADRSGSTKLEFRDDGRAYFTDPSGQTIVASYEEDGDLRVLVTLPQATVVLTREGRWLVGGPLQLRRVDDES